MTSRQTLHKGSVCPRLFALLIIGVFFCCPGLSAARCVKSTAASHDYLKPGQTTRPPFETYGSLKHRPLFEAATYSRNSWAVENKKWTKNSGTGKEYTSPDEKQRLEHRMRQWQRMPAQKRQRYRELYQEYRRLSDQEQKRLQRDLDRWEQLTPAEKEAIRQKFRK